MINLLLTLHVWGLALLNQTLEQTLERATTTLQAPRRGRGSSRNQCRHDRGSVTIEQVIWAGAVIVIVGIVVAAITGYVRSESAKIK